MKTKIVTFGEILLRISKPGYQRLFQGHHMLAIMVAVRLMQPSLWLI